MRFNQASYLSACLTSIILFSSSSQISASETPLECSSVDKVLRHLVNRINNNFQHTYFTGWQSASSQANMDHDTSTTLIISNISRQQVAVTIELYNQDGSQIIDDNQPTAGYIITKGMVDGSYSEVDYTASFDLAAGTSARLKVMPMDFRGYGHGKISWSSDNQQQRVALLAQGFINSEDPDSNTKLSEHSLCIHSGKPF